MASWSPQRSPKASASRSHLTRHCGAASSSTSTSVPGRRAILRDRDAFPIFVDAVRSIEPAVVRTLERVASEVDEATVDRLADTVRRIFGRVLKELADLDNPMRTLTGTEEGQGALLVAEASPPGARQAGGEPWGDLEEPPAMADLLPEPEVENPEDPPTPSARPGGGGSQWLPTVLPDPSPDGVRSRFDPDQGIVFYNENHPDYLKVKDSDQELVDYLSTLVAKEYVVYNNPRAEPNDLAEEMVRWWSGCAATCQSGCSYSGRLGRAHFGAREPLTRI